MGNIEVFIVKDDTPEKIIIPFDGGPMKILAHDADGVERGRAAIVEYLKHRKGELSL